MSRTLSLSTSNWQTSYGVCSNLMVSKSTEEAETLKIVNLKYCNRARKYKKMIKDKAIKRETTLQHFTFLKTGLHLVNARATVSQTERNNVSVEERTREGCRE